MWVKEKQRRNAVWKSLRAPKVSKIKSIAALQQQQDDAGMFGADVDDDDDDADSYIGGYDDYGGGIGYDAPEEGMGLFGEQQQPDEIAVLGLKSNGNWPRSSVSADIDDGSNSHEVSVTYEDLCRKHVVCMCISDASDKRTHTHTGVVSERG